jgi:hypothetical protein
VLLASGYIAGGTLCGLIIAFFAFLPDAFNNALNVGRLFGPTYNAADSPYPKLVSLAMFVVLAVILFRIGSQKTPVANGPPPPGEQGHAPNPSP